MILSSLVVAVVLFLAIARGIIIGQQTAQAEITSQAAGNLAKGLQYFYQDQNHFPNGAELSNQLLMQNYFTVFPPADILSANCSQSFAYKRLSPSSAQVNFCLPKAAGAYQAGWNALNLNPPQSASQ